MSATVTIDQLTPVITKAASDPAFRAELLSNPSAALSSAGISIPSGASVKVVEDSQNLRYAVVPSRPSDLTDTDIQELVAASVPSATTVENKILAYAHLVAKSWLDSALQSQLL